MQDRRSVWSSDEVRELAPAFVLAMESIEDLRREGGASAALFGEVAAAAEHRRRGTQQGIYFFAPNGRTLASGNHDSAETVVARMQRALAAYAAMDPKERRGGTPLTVRPDRLEALYPSDGLVLRQTSRYLTPDVEGSRRDRFLDPLANYDFAWFARHEIATWLPADVARGAELELPQLAERLARHNLQGTTRAHGEAYAEADVRCARLRVEVVDRVGQRAVLELRGELRVEDRDASRFVRGSSPVPRQRERGAAVALRGTATFDLESRRFIAFELVAVGTMTGGRVRTKLADVPFAAVWQLADPDDPLERQKPLLLSSYADRLRGR